MIKLKRRSKILILMFIFLVWVESCVLGIYQSSVIDANNVDLYYMAGKHVLEKVGLYDYFLPHSKLDQLYYLPITACFFSLFAFFPMPVMAILWISLLWVLFGVNIFLIFKILEVKPSEYKSFFEAVPKGERNLLFFISVFVLVLNLITTQVNMLLMFLCLLCLLAWKRNQNLMAGISLSAAIFIKVIPIIFCLYFLIKKAWKLLLGVFIGSLLWAVVIPSFVFGWKNNQIYHYQWYSYMIKPGIVDALQKIKPELTDSKIISAKELHQISGARYLVETTNQSLSAAMIRLLIKDREQYQITKTHPLIPLFGGLSKEALFWLLALIRVLFLGVCVFLWARNKYGDKNLQVATEISLVILTMTLLSPITRPHNYIFWIFIYLTLFLICYRNKSILSKFFTQTAYISAFLCLLIKFPHAASVGLGAWANLIFWFGCAHQLKVISQKV